MVFEILILLSYRCVENCVSCCFLQVTLAIGTTVARMYLALSPAFHVSAKRSRRQPPFENKNVTNECIKISSSTY